MTDESTRPDTPGADPADASPSIHDAPAGEPTEPAPAVGITGSAGAEAAAAAKSPRARRRSPFYLRGRRLRLPRSRSGLFALLLVLGGLGGVATFSAVSLIQWTETADFCGRCHSMAPELAAYEAGPHANVTCAECHVEPGITGWIRAKLNGTRQLVEMVLGTYPTPIPPPEHTDLPSADDTCAHCHDPLRRALAGLKTRTVFSEDEDNTRQFVGLMVRPGGGDAFDVDRSVHWHILREVSYATPDEDAASIDYVAATQPDGTVREYVSQDMIRVSDDVQPDIDAILAADAQHLMNCYDCHNRAGHSIPNPRTSLDYELSTGGIDATLPYIKREGMRLLWSSYPDDATADEEIAGLRDFYAEQYPDVYRTKAAQINTAIDRVQVLYRLTASPEMRVTAQTYPDHLGHTDFPGCFRCHDGGHVLVVDGVVTAETIPSTCNACHTFPQLGPAVASLPLGEPPSTHKSDSLWVFSHKDVAPDLDPGGNTCGECHARDYCVNCHATGAVTVDHDTMATNHAAVIRAQGNEACAYCHQPVYCARCHSDPVLPVTTPFLHGPPDEAAPDPGVAPTPRPATEGATWPLATRPPAAGS
jgi:nitrate/TMAO reductase-like tetraheme cytochrome c subunit